MRGLTFFGEGGPAELVVESREEKSLTSGIELGAWTDN